MISQITLNDALIQKNLALGHFQWNESDANLRLREWVFCELSDLRAPLGLLSQILSTEVAREKVIQTFLKEMMGLEKDTKVRWLALLSLLNQIPDWDCRLYSLTPAFAEKGEKASNDRLKEVFKQIIYRIIDSTIDLIHKKQKRDERWKETPGLLNAFKGQMKALNLFLGKFSAVKGEMGKRRTALDLQPCAAEAYRHCGTLLGIQLLCQKAMQAECDKSLKDYEKQQKTIVLRCEVKFQQLEKKYVASNPGLADSLKKAFADIQKQFFDNKFQSLAQPIKLVELLCAYDKAFDKNPSFPRAEVIERHYKWAVNEIKKIAKKPCTCTGCKLTGKEEESQLDAAARKALIDHLSLCTRFLGQIKDELNRLRVQRTGATVVASLWEELEEEEDLQTPDESSVHDSGPSSESSDQAISEEDEMPAAMPMVQLFLAGINDPTCEKLEAFPMLLRFLSQTINAGSRTQIAYQEALSHIHLAHHGLQALTETLAKRDFLGATAVIPMLIMDWHVQAEQLLNFNIRLQGKPEIEGHSLVSLCKASGDWKGLPIPLQRHLADLDLALLWYRYPYSCLDRLRPGEAVPEVLNMMWRMAEALQSGSVSAVQLKEWVAFVRRSQESALLFFAHISPLRNHGKDLADLTALWKAGEWVEKFWEELAPSKDSSPKPFESKLLSIIDKIFALNHPNRKVDCKIKAALRDVRHHLERLEASRPLIMGSDCCAWHARNLMQLQWVIEQIYMARLFLIDPEAKFEHDFALLQHRLGDSFNQPEAKLAEVYPFNWGTGVHHPWQKKRLNPRLGDFISAVEEDSRSFGLEFQDRKEKSFSRAFYNQVNGSLDQGLYQTARLLAQLLQEFEEAVVPSLAIFP